MKHAVSKDDTEALAMVTLMNTIIGIHCNEYCR